MTPVKFAAGTLALAFITLGLATVNGQKAPDSSSRGYPAPRFPRSMAATPKSVDELMPYARAMARNKANILGLGFGAMNPGDKIVLVDTAASEDVVVQAVKRALEERKVIVTILHDYDLAGVSRADALALRKGTVEKATTKDGYLELLGWIRGVPNQQGVEWLKRQRPDLYDKLFHNSPEELPPAIKAVNAKFLNNAVPKALVAYLRAHPDIRGLFQGKAGPLWMNYHPLEDKWLGTFTADDRYGLINETATYPADVWMLTEELTMEPLAYLDRVEVTDPEGTNVNWNLTEDQAQRWSKGVYLRGHLFMFPNEAYGQYALSVVNYPALQKEWIPMEPIVLMNGTVAGTASHMGFLPRIEEQWVNGYLADIKGGGYYGETMREFLKKYPNINTLKFPHYDHPGYYYHFESALGTNPKIVRNTSDLFGSILPERMRDGVIHWALGAHHWNDPESMGGRSTAIFNFAEKNKEPGEHGFHIHTYFNTYRAHLRNTSKWLTLVDKGHLTALDNHEVRALASRYGDPDVVLGELWVPEMPGINAPGRYEDFARDPYTYSRGVMAKVLAGTYEHLFSLPKPGVTQ